MNQGLLYVVATPIGNLADIGQRAIEVLSNVDLIAAEDTRHSRHLLDHYNIQASVQAYHDHNEEQLTPRLLEKLKLGENIAIISDAGTPLLSDPGYRLVKAAQEAGIRVSPVPGACAAIAALSASGLATDEFHFAGFPPAKSAARQSFFKRFSKQTATLIFYESGHRIDDSLADMVAVYGGGRQAVIAREITKTFETIRKASLDELLDWVTQDQNQRKGEIVVLVAGNDAPPGEQISIELEDMLTVLMDQLPTRQASQLAAKISGMKKNQVYKLALELSDK